MLRAGVGMMAPGPRAVPGATRVEKAGIWSSMSVWKLQQQIRLLPVLLGPSLPQSQGTALPVANWPTWYSQCWAHLCPGRAPGAGQPQRSSATTPTQAHTSLLPCTGLVLLLGVLLHLFQQSASNELPFPKANICINKRTPFKNQYCDVHQKVNRPSKAREISGTTKPTL